MMSVSMPEQGSVPALRLRAINHQPIRPRQRYVLYWMTAARRTRYSFALQHAVDWARSLNRPLVILEALRVGYAHASDRLHRFVLQGMTENRRRLDRRRVRYHPYVEPQAGAGKGLLAALAEQACLVVTDDAPFFFLPRMLAAAGRSLPCRLQAVDGNGVLPLRATERVFKRAVDFRRHLQRSFLEAPPALPRPDPLYRVRLPTLSALPRSLTQRWPAATPRLRRADPGVLAELPLDHHVGPAPRPGGSAAGERALQRFLRERLSRYAEHKNHPDAEADSGLSPYLHFGHVAPQQVLVELLAQQRWSPERLGDSARGAREGFWGLSPAAEAFVDQLVTWRELGFNTAWQVPDAQRYESLPAWTRETLADHAADPREPRYSLEALEDAETHDPVWNATQRQLLAEGRIQGYLRMLWGKKILEWAPDPPTALRWMLTLNDRYALDGRDPNSVSGITWVLGRYDRPWAPERPIFGRVRYMSSDAARRKLRMTRYLERFG
jgi:deoxyribodipyrimidine photo-lyase